MKAIILTQGQFAVVDDEDYYRISQHKWYAWKHGHTYYARTNTRVDDVHKNITMHRFIIQPEEDEMIDHADNDGLNNTRDNLRICTASQNHANQQKTRGSSQYKGVSFSKRANKWEVYINKDGKRYRLGYFTDEKKAAEAYDQKAKELFGEFAELNIDG